MNPEVLGSQSNIIITFTASFLIWLMFGGLLVLWRVDGKIKQEQAAHALLSAMVAWIISQMIKGLYPTVRPFKLNGFPPLTLTVPGDSAFPSGHAAVAFALATSVWLHDKKVGSVFLALAFLVGVGRVLGNVHYAVDILGGAIVGVLVALAIDKLHVYNLITKRSTKK